MTATLPTAVARDIPASRRERMTRPVAVIGGLALATLALHVRDPHTTHAWGQCPSAALGIYCPGCGGLRAVNDLTNGDLLGAASSNLAFVVALPFILVGLALWVLGRWQGRSYAPPMSVIRPVAYASLVLLAVFTVLRNLPVGSWLAP